MAAPGATPLQLEWPRVVFQDGVTNTIYQPQLQSWDYVTFKALAAVAVQPPGAGQPTFGTIQVTAKTFVERAERTVDLEQLEVTWASFPAAGPEASAYLATFRSLIPRELQSISLDRLEASLAILQARQRAVSQPLNNTPPTIVFSTKPALLVPVDGPPVYRPVPGTGLERVINTRALLLREAGGKHFLHLFDGYVEANGLGGPWTVARNVSSDMHQAEERAVQQQQVDLLAGQENPQTKQKPSLGSTSVPAVFVTTVPTELVVTWGTPQWAVIPSTQLRFVTNTLAHVFQALADQQFYVLLSGRWFRAASLDGPWEYVAGAALPRDFARIPDDSPQENVKASVPGTHQAEEAAIANAIPSMVKVERQKATLDPVPQYEGTPQLAPIEGTPLSYVTDCAMPVIQVESNSWYTCQNGVWFLAVAPTGPWQLATNVPAVIYSIPPSSPLHYVVYSRVYRYDADFVWVGTTPGYYGTVVSPDGTVVFGTGYSHSPYVGSNLYVASPVTYGYGANPCWTPWVGWSYGYAVAWPGDEEDWSWWCACPPVVYWGPYWYSYYGSCYNAWGGVTAWGPYGWAGTTGYIYHQNGPWSGVSRGAAGYNAWTGNEWATSYGRAYNSTTGTRVVGQRGAVENVYTGNYAYGGRGAFYNESTGAAGAGRKVTWGNEDTGKQGTAGRGTVYNPNSGEMTHISGAKGESGGFVRVNDQVIVGKDGNYYRSDGQGGWTPIPKPPTRDNTAGVGGSVPRPNQGVVEQSQWPQAQRAPVEPQQRQELENEYWARQAGAQRQQSFQMNRPPGFGGGGRRR